MTEQTQLANESSVAQSPGYADSEDKPWLHDYSRIGAMTMTHEQFIESHRFQRNEINNDRWATETELAASIRADLQAALERIREAEHLAAHAMTLLAFLTSDQKKRLVQDSGSVAPIVETEAAIQ